MVSRQPSAVSRQPSAVSLFYSKVSIALPGTHKLIAERARVRVALKLIAYLPTPYSLLPLKKNAILVYH